MKTTFAFIPGQRLILEPSDTAREWTVLENYAVLINELRVVIPAGFTTDLASVPPFLRFIIDDDDSDILKPAVVHDFLYRTQGQVVGTDANGTYDVTLSRGECDDVLLLAMEARGARPIRRRAVYLGVRFFGGIAWRRHAGSSLLSVFQLFSISAFLSLSLSACSSLSGPGRVGVAVGSPNPHPGLDPKNLGMESMDYLFWLFSLPVGPPLHE